MSSRFVPAEDWAEVIQMTGKNGVLLYVGALLWWGDAVAAEEDEALVKEWKIAVGEVGCVLAMVVFSMAAAKKADGDTDATSSTRPKRQQGGEDSLEDKENAPPPK
ncbi:hypothetical protein K438DRAFT_1986602 [Mycena galopus ATCC 62051]|nr:hypothetical protein K438DRAFT_1986602 [Mycena galopus ATCC 62051]